MPPGAQFPQPFQEWPHIGRQWPPHNVESDQAEGLVAWWPTLASRGERALRDLSGHNPLPLTGAGWTSLPAIGAVADYDGTDDYAGIDAPISTLQDDWAMAVWAQWDVISSDNYDGHMLVYNGDDNAGYGFGYRNVAGTYEFAALFGGVIWVEFGMTPVIDTLYHFLVTRRGGTTYGYVNGVQQSGTAANTPNAPQNNFTIGCETNGAGSPSRFADAKIGGTRFYTRVKVLSGCRGLPL